MNHTTWPILILLLICIIIMPWTVVWATNTLFPALAIPYTFQTWLATIIIGGFLTSNVNYKK